MNRIALVVGLLGYFSTVGFAQTWEELVADAASLDNVVTQSMGYSRQSYSPLDEINKSNIKRLVPIWNASLMNQYGCLLYTSPSPRD